MNNLPMILVAAYGRHYPTTAHAIEDYYAGKDFKIAGTSTYCSCRDFINQPVILGIGNGLYEEVTYYG